MLKLGSLNVKKSLLLFLFFGLNPIRDEESLTEFIVKFQSLTNKMFLKFKITTNFLSKFFVKKDFIEFLLIPTQVLENANNFFMIFVAQFTSFSDLSSLHRH